MPESSSVTIEKLDSFRDVRGLVFEPVGPGDLVRQGNVHVVVTEPGCVRGNHYHRQGSEITVVVGPALFRYRDGDGVCDVEFAAGEVARVRIPPGVAHAFQNPGPGPMLLIGFNTEVHDRARPDVVADVLVPV
jgi:dTDP-4-dehydrorhamnose 3,5-epimerase-like enzyme